MSFLPSSWSTWIENFWASLVEDFWVTPVDSFWASPFADFLKTPSDSIPAAIAVVALVVGAVALVRSIILAPKPDLQLTVYYLFDTTTGMSDGIAPEYLLNVSVLNRGAGVALDVRVTVKPKSRKKETFDLGSVSTDETKRHQFELLNDGGSPKGRVIVKWKRGKRRGVRETYGP